MLDVRYHMFYLCAIFLMMGFGILIGEAVYPHQAKAQTKFLATLKEKANDAVLKGQAARNQLVKTEQALDALRPGLVRGTLDGKRVIIVQTGDYPEAATTASDALADAGATVAAKVALTDGWGTLDAGQDETGILRSLALLLAQGTAGHPANQQARDSLEGQGLISVTGDVSKTTTLFVFVGGHNDPDVTDGRAGLDTTLISQLNTVTENGVRIVGCEPLDAVASSIQVYQGAGLASVDCVDQPLGQLALPFALRGETDSYGFKSTASRQLPPSLAGDAAS